MDSGAFRPCDLPPWTSPVSFFSLQPVPTQLAQQVNLLEGQVWHRLVASLQMMFSPIMLTLLWWLLQIGNLACTDTAPPHCGRGAIWQPKHTQSIG